MRFNWLNFPISVEGATGGLIGETVIICGGGYHNGYNYTIIDECYSLTSEKATLVTHMSVGRSGAASIVFNDDALWVTGGFYHLTTIPVDKFEVLNSTEYVTMIKTMPGPDLPMALEGHAMVSINSTCSMVIGGGHGEGANYCLFHLFNVKNSEYFLLFLYRYWYIPYACHSKPQLVSFYPIFDFGLYCKVVYNVEWLIFHDSFFI